MAFVGQTFECQIRPNKEPEWKNICNNVFDEYLDDDDIFGIPANQQERSSSIESYNLFVSGSSVQSNQTDGISPVQSWDHGSVDAVDGARYTEAQQPTAKESGDFWAKTLKALEQNAAESERREQIESVRPHSDFLSLGGFPSPPAIPSSPIDQSLSVSRHRSRSRVVTNGREASQTRSVSRGRPTGVSKPKTQSAGDPNATVRKSASPAKAVTPSRFRAGFRNIWDEKTSRSPMKNEILHLIHNQGSKLPPPDQWSREDELFGMPSSAHRTFDGYADQISPLTSNFQRANIQSSSASPDPFDDDHVEDPSYQPSRVYQPHTPSSRTVPLNDTAPLFFPERTSSLAPNKIQDFDFGFEEGEAWRDTSAPEPMHYPQYGMNQIPVQDPYSNATEYVAQSIETYPFGLHSEGPHGEGLGTNCDPSLISNQSALGRNSRLPRHDLYSTQSHPPPHIHQTLQSHVSHGPNSPISTINPSHMSNQGNLQRTPRKATRRYEPLLRSPSLSPCPQTEPRNSSRRSQSRPRNPSSHRRAKSTDPGSTRKAGKMDGAGFVNYTPHDSNKLLSGVAPSGSSKTKARREREAADKRKRLSQAAVKAIVDAGGDLDYLAEAGLI